MTSNPAYTWETAAIARSEVTQASGTLPRAQPEKSGNVEPAPGPASSAGFLGAEDRQHRAQFRARLGDFPFGRRGFDHTRAREQPQRFLAQFSAPDGHRPLAVAPRVG